MHTFCEDYFFKAKEWTENYNNFKNLQYLKLMRCKKFFLNDDLVYFSPLQEILAQVIKRQEVFVARGNPIGHLWFH